MVFFWWWYYLSGAASSPPEKTTEAINAVKTIGTNCFPWLRHMLASEESIWERTAAALETRQAMIHFSLVPARLTRARAVEGYAVLGTVAEAAVPDLIDLMDPKRSPEVRIVAARALGQIGPGARQAIPALQRALQDTNAEVSKSAMFALANIQMSIRDLSMRERRF